MKILENGTKVVICSYDYYKRKYNGVKTEIRKQVHGFNNDDEIMYKVDIISTPDGNYLDFGEIELEPTDIALRED